MFEYFYHEIFRRTIISFGSLFNDITIKHENADDVVTSQLRVPLAYGPTQKFLARLKQSPDLNKSIALTLPRMSFEFIGLQYDPSRKVTTTQRFTKGLSADKTSISKAYMPVPYNMTFELSIMTKLNDDMLQIVEQILPYFQPSYNMTINLLETIGEKRDIPVILESIVSKDDYEGDFTTRRALIYTLRFSAKTYLFGPISTATADIITKSTVGFIAGNLSGTVPDRDVSYSTERRALKNYSGQILTVLMDDVSVDDTIIKVVEPDNITVDTYIDLDGEEVYVKSVGTDSITVSRGQDGTTITTHLNGAEIKSITAADADLIPDGDDFGFSGAFG